MKHNKIIDIFFLVFIIIVLVQIVNISIIRRSKFEQSYNDINNVYVYGFTAPRGKILDVNGNILVDNVGVNTIVYNRINGSNQNKEISIAKSLATILKFDENLFTESKLKTFYLVTHDNGKDLITSDEYKLYKERKISKSELDILKKQKITQDILDSMSYEDKNAAYIYSLLSNGYYYEDKIIKKKVSDEEAIKISDLNLPGIRVDLTWERYYPYDGVLKTIFGNISKNGVPLEYKDYYKEKGIKMDRIVGTSGLELEYDDYLRGKDAKYILDDGKLTLVEREEEGSDLCLSIDIEKQLEIESIIKEEMINAHKMSNTKYFNHAYALVGNPKTGEIISLVGLQLNNDHFVDISINIINSSYTVGSIVKGATISVGYKENLIEPGKKILDSCIKVSGAKEKCSWTSLGYIDDISALAQSSNYYQFLIAAKLANRSYTWNSKLNATDEHFKIYRDMLASYGLGVKTGIDLPNEKTGIIGSKVRDDLLLNLSIGQYDTYTPIEVLQYINTVANAGTKLKPSLMKKIVKGDEIILENKIEEIGKVDLNEEYISRIQRGFHEVTVSGTARNYVNNIPSAGKTGTSETFIDTNGDGKIDTKTTSTAFIMYAPFNNPEYSIALITPNLSTGGHKYAFNLRVNRQIVNYLFEIS